VICFELKINDKLICTAGVSDLRFLTAALTLMRREEEELAVSVGGMAFHDDGTSEERRWVNQSVTLGDKIAIRILDLSTCDQPEESLANNPVQEKEINLRIFERMKKQFDDTSE